MMNILESEVAEACSKMGRSCQVDTREYNLMTSKRSRAAEFYIEELPSQILNCSEGWVTEMGAGDLNRAVAIQGDRRDR